MSNDSVQSYASAFYEAAFEHWLVSLDGAVKVLAESTTLLDELQEPGVDFEKRADKLRAILPPDTDALVLNFLYSLMQRGDLKLIGEITEAVRNKVRDAGRGPILVEVTSATALDATQQQTLETQLKRQYGSDLQYEYNVDPAILGGLIVRVGDKLIDGSVASRLAAMKQSLGVVVTG